jgi:hypothetical protein
MGLESYKYDPETGKFYNRHGKQIGSYTKKYGRIVHRGKEYTMGRVAVFLMKGVWPEGEVDHINGDKYDNRWCNLRECSREENARNKSKYKTNKTGFKGVYPVGKKYGVKIQVNGYPIYLGVFASPEMAALVYNDAAVAYHGNFAKLN